MNNKVLVIVYVPLLDEHYDLFIPINKKIGTIKKYIISSINELSDNSLLNVDNMNLYSKEDCKLYDSNIYVSNSNIVNGTILMLL